MEASAPLKRPHERRYLWGLWELIQTLNPPLEIQVSKTDASFLNQFLQTTQSER